MNLKQDKDCIQWKDLIKSFCKDKGISLQNFCHFLQNEENCINSFSGEYAFLSNFYMAPINYKNIIWPSSEHAYQAMKSNKKEDWLKILECKTPGRAKRLGNTLSLRNNWDEKKDVFMFNIVLNKFRQNLFLKKMLLETNNLILIEGNTWGDTYWGKVNDTGQNKLGIILMEVRNILR